MRQSGHQRDVGPRLQFEMVIRLDMRCTNQVDISGIRHDQLGPLTDSALHRGTKHGMAVRRVRTNHEDDIGLSNRIKGLGTR